MVRLGLIGGGPGSFIGKVHAAAAALDRRMQLVAGAFSSDAERSRSAGRAYGVDPDRAYPDLATMIATERMREDGIQAVAIATPNHLHLAAARAALEAGLAVISDKPPAANLAETIEIADIIARTNGLYSLTFTYTGYPMIREARARIAAGELGSIRKVVAEYFQGWLAEPIEQSGNKQADWRVDPTRSGVGGCITDIGIHAFNLVEFVTGLDVVMLSADLGTIVPNRALDDDCTVLLKFSNAARGYIAASQVATGERNNLRLRVYGTRGSLSWCHEKADRLRLLDPSGNERVVWAGTSGVGPASASVSRLPAGHPEGFIEAFATLYRDVAEALDGRPSDAMQTIGAGLRSMAFVETAIMASAADHAWVPLRI